MCESLTVYLNSINVAENIWVSEGFQSEMGRSCQLYLRCGIIMTQVSECMAHCYETKCTHDLHMSTVGFQCACS